MTDQDKKDSQSSAINTITVHPGGPLKFDGQLAIINGTDEDPDLQSQAYFCSCGQSSNKPYCDGSHKQADLDKNVALADAGKPLEESSGLLSVTLAQNGPLRISGNMTITIQGLDTQWSGTRTALCRCGLSQNKPFCDGSHRDSDFKS